MLTRRQFATGIAGGAALASASQLRSAQAASGPAGRGAEAAALRAFAEATHPRGREAAADPQWRSRWTLLERGADAMPDGAYFIALRRALGWFADGHTTPLPFEFTGGVPDALKGGPFATTLPVRARVFHDGAVVTSASAAYRSLLGARIDRIGSLDSGALIRANARDWPGNAAWAHRWAALPFSSPALLQGLGAIAGPTAPVRFTFAGSGAVELPPLADGSAELDQVTRPTTAVERWAVEANGGNFVRPHADRKAIFVSIDEMGDIAGRTFEQLTRDAFAALETAGPERVIIDLRRNGGGDNYLGEPLRKRLAASRFNRPGRLYVLVGPRTFSAAQNLANRLERETFATFVGEPTGGAPNHYGDAKPFTGQATGITSIVSTLPWFDSYPQDRREWIMPDLLVPEISADWLAGRDRALEAALAHRPAEIDDELNRERIMFYRRASQKQDWTPFWRAAA